MSFLSADGFPITLDGVVEFRILPEKVAEMFVKYNESANGDAIDEEIIAKIITPESRSLCRIGGSKLSGGQFISGEDREKFQTDLVKSLTENCQKQGIEILAVAITSIQPPADIAEPVQQREVAKQKLAQFKREKLQQLSEAKLKVEVVLAEQKKGVVEAEQEVVEKTTKAEEEQKVAVTLAEQKLKVAQTQLEAAKDKASAIVAKAEAEAEVINFDNAAEAAGLAAQVAAFDGDGAAMARNMLLGKIAPSFRTILGNSEGPLMDLFSQFTQRPDGPRTPPAAGRSTRPGVTATAPPRSAVAPVADRAQSVQPSRRRSPFLRRTSHDNVSELKNVRTVAKTSLTVAVLLVVGYIGIWQWMICRTEVPPGYSLLVRYKGPWPFGSSTMAPEGTLVQNAGAGPAGSGRHPRRHARPRAPFLLTARVRDPPRQGRGDCPRQDRRTCFQDRQAAPRGGLPGRRQGISRHPAQGLDAGPLPHQHIRLRCQGRRCRRLRRTEHAAQAHGRRPHFDSAWLRRRGDQQGERSRDRSRPGHSAADPPTGDLFLEPRGKADRHRQHWLFRDQPDR